MKFYSKVISVIVASALVLNIILGIPNIIASADSVVSTSGNEPSVEYVAQGQQAEVENGEVETKEVEKLPDSLVSVDKQAKHSKRLYEEEKSLYTAVFENVDGSKTMYSFGHPIKYKDKNGEIKDISLNLKCNSKGDYVSESSDVMVTFPENLREGINLSKEDEEINITMHMLYKGKDASESKIKGSTSKAVYEYNSCTNIEYSLTYNGIKEDIIVSEYNGISEYKFKLSTDGLKLTEKDGCLTLVDKKGVDKVCVGDVIIYTANHKKTEYGTMSYETVKENEEYIVTIHIDEEFLKAKDTAYPIIIDPSIEVSRTESGTTGIEDVTINSAGGSNGSATALYVGRRDSVGISRIMMKFPGLNLAYIAASDRITSAYLNIRDITQTTDVVNVKCYTFAGNEWSASTANWSNINPNSITTYLDAKNVYYGYGAAHDHTYTFNITKAVKGWKVGNMNRDKGIVLKLDNSEESGTEEIVRAFGSYDRSSGQPYLVVNYNTTGELPFADNTFYYNNWYTGQYLGYDSAVTSLRGKTSTLNKKIKWEIRKVDGGYIIRSKEDTTKYLASPVTTTATTVELATIEDVSIPERCKWTITKLNDGYCMMQNIYSGKYLYSTDISVGQTAILGTEGTLTNRQRVWRYASEIYYGPGNSFTKTELNSNFAIDTCTIFAGESIIPNITKTPSNALWAEVTDFTYSGYDTTKLTYDALTGRFTSISTSTSLYRAQVTATHKVTGLSKTFSFVVNPSGVLVGVEEETIDRLSWMGDVENNLIDMEFGAVYKLYDEFTESEIENVLDLDSNYVVAFRCHGSKAELYSEIVGTVIILGSGVNYREYRSDEIPENLDFTNLGLVLFTACKTGYGGENGLNLPSVAVERGAETAIGFEANINTKEADDWTKELFWRLKNGQTVGDACDAMREDEEYKGTGLDTVVICGNKSLKLN